MTITKVLLISPNRFTEPFPVYPLALSYLKSSLNTRFKELEVELFDFNLADMTAFKAVLKRFQPDLTGISLRNIDTVNIFDDKHFVEDCRNLIVEIKNTLPAVTVLGGAGFSIFPETIFDLIKPDYGVCGEGEETLCQLIQALNQGEDVDSIEGLVFEKDHGIVRNIRKTFCKDSELVFDEQLVDHYWEVAGMLNLQTKRGCPYQCSYCTYPLIDGNTVRTRDPAKVVESLKQLNSRRGIHYFFFTDSVFNINNEYNRELASQIIASGLEIQWGAYFTPHNLDIDMLQLLKKSGLTHIEFGTESLSNSTLKAYNKRFSVAEILETARVCNELQIHSAHFLILGGSGETEESIEETIRTSNQIEKTIFFPFFGMRIYPNTKVYSQAIAEGRISPDASILEPTFYLAEGIDYKSIKKRTKTAANRWIFPDDNFQKPMEMLRKKGAKGPLWELLIKKQ